MGEEPVDVACTGMDEVCCRPSEGPCPDTDDDGLCDADDRVCNADGNPLNCRRAAPPL